MGSDVDKTMTNEVSIKSQINNNPIPLYSFQKRPKYIINALKKRDESFYSKGKKDSIFKRNNLKDYPIFLYSTCYFKYINTYLRLGKMYKYDKKNDWFPKRFFSLEELHSWIWCLHKEICSRDSNVENRTLVYRGIRNVILQDNFRVGMTFCFAEFLSTSTDINTSIRFLKDSKIKEK